MPEWSFTLEHLQKNLQSVLQFQLETPNLQIFVVVLWVLSFSGHKYRINRFVHWLQVLRCLKFQRGRIIWGRLPQHFPFYEFFCPAMWTLNNPDHFSDSTSGIFVLKKTTHTCFKSSFWRSESESIRIRIRIIILEEISRIIESNPTLTSNKPWQQVPHPAFS